ncbi:MAG TPA: SxtJ family membrane protein [Methylovirgula sp.]|nr:SxtJ family membrane protein [Methylovirgula sp.]
MQTHETVMSFRKLAAGSNRKFGITLGLVLGVLAVWPLLHHNSPRWWLLAIAVAFLAAGLIFPNSLTQLNRAWFKLGLALNAIVGPVIMGVLFFGAVVPVGWLLRKKGEDPLRLKLEPEAATYWTRREPLGPLPGTLTKQF